MSTLSVPSIFSAYATPAPRTICVATGEPPEVMLCRESEKWPGVCLPPEAAFASTESMRSSGVIPIRMQSTTSR